MYGVSGSRFLPKSFNSGPSTSNAKISGFVLKKKHSKFIAIMQWTVFVKAKIKFTRIHASMGQPAFEIRAFTHPFTLCSPSQKLSTLFSWGMVPTTTCIVILILKYMIFSSLMTNIFKRVGIKKELISTCRDISSLWIRDFFLLFLKIGNKEHTQIKQQTTWVLSRMNCQSGQKDEAFTASKLKLLLNFRKLLLISVCMPHAKAVIWTCSSRGPSPFYICKR